MSLLNKYIPPAGIPFSLSLKAAAIGVGRVGIAGNFPFGSLPLNWELSGVFGERSDPPSSTFVTDKLRLFMFFRLDEEKSFRNPPLD